MENQNLQRGMWKIKRFDKKEACVNNIELHEYIKTTFNNNNFNIAFLD